MRDPTYKIALSFKDANGNDVTLATECVENQIATAHILLSAEAANLQSTDEE
jgi:hypothetical protein